MRERRTVIALILVHAPIAVLALIGLYMLAVGSAAGADAANDKVQIGRFSSRFTSSGLYLDFDGLPLFKGGVLQAFYSDARQDDYGSGDKPPLTTISTLHDGGRMYTSMFGDSGAAGTLQARQTISIHADGSIAYEVHANWSGEKAAMLEWNPLRLWAYPSIGGGYKADTVTGEVLGRIGRIAHAADYPASTLAGGWKSFTIHSPLIGELKFDGSADLVAFDAREDRFLNGLGVIWIGVTGVQITPGVEVSRHVSFRITPFAATSARAAASIPVTVAAVRRLRAAERTPCTRLNAMGESAIIPRPKKAQFTGEIIKLGSRLNIYTGSGGSANSALTPMCRQFAEEIRRQTGMAVSLRPENNLTAPGIHIRLQSESKADMLPFEGYCIKASGRRIDITGSGVGGCRYGLETLRQMVERDSSGRFGFAAGELTDWPSLVFRGAHIFVGKDAKPFLFRLIASVLARYKLNAMVIECEYVRWKSHPELWRDNSMDPDDLHAVVEYAREHGLEPIPLINTLGHTEWMFKNGTHLDLAEDESSPHNYDPENPATYRLVFDVFGEALQLFDHPLHFHIGHDEVKVPSYDTVGKYPARPANVAKGAGSLFLEDTDRLAAWLHEHGSTPMMWGDMLLNSSEAGPTPGVAALSPAFAPTVEEARRRRAAVPPGTILCDWQYEPGLEQRNGLRLFEDAGHPAIACAWYQPKNILGWARQAAAEHALGTLQTTWAGYDIDERILETEFPQFSAFVLAADAAWSGGDQSPTDYNAPQVFRRSYREAGGSSLAKTESGWYISLKSAANISLFDTGEGAASWSAYPAALKEPVADTTEIDGDDSIERQTDGIRLKLLGTHPGGVMLAGSANPPMLPFGYGVPMPVIYPEKVRLKIGQTAREICFLQATGVPVNLGDAVATYRIEYVDGTNLDVPIRYGYEIRALNDRGETGYSASPVEVSGPTTQVLRLYRWTNPYPKRRVATIEFTSTHAYAAPALFAVTGVQ